MIDEMMRLLEKDDEAKALTRQITGHKDLLSSSESDRCSRRSSRQPFETSRSASR